MPAAFYFSGFMDKASPFLDKPMLPANFDAMFKSQGTADGHQQQTYANAAMAALAVQRLSALAGPWADKAKSAQGQELLRNFSQAVSHQRAGDAQEAATLLRGLIRSAAQADGQAMDIPLKKAISSGLESAPVAADPSLGSPNAKM